MTVRTFWEEHGEDPPDLGALTADELREMCAALLDVTLKTREATEAAEAKSRRKTAEIAHLRAFVDRVERRERARLRGDAEPCACGSPSILRVRVGKRRRSADYRFFCSRHADAHLAYRFGARARLIARLAGEYLREPTPEARRELERGTAALEVDPS